MLKKNLYFPIPRNSHGLKKETLSVRLKPLFFFSVAKNCPSIITPRFAQQIELGEN